MDPNFGGAIVGASTGISGAEPVVTDNKKGKKGGAKGSKKWDEDGNKTTKELAVQLVAKHAFGSCAIKRDGIQSYISLVGEKESSDRVVFKVGRHLVIYTSDGAHQQIFVRTSAGCNKCFAF